ncbi:aminopeptidase N [Parenemella sanctibonifatiensis]|uniref:Aminopeptidase N n=1 Tax=Parenemella sanctibonifatiensis TaxID=2016505 RepID=A0A255E8B7_9ACTN|nr:aminopeptidase N [Parenemella sanctibonifatiensis]OYN87804.1 aminopeptidase N [Parenemella sanctibonifatiensis]
MYPANLTRAEAQERSTVLATHHYDVAVDLSGQDGRVSEDQFLSTSTVRFTANEAAETHIDLIADGVLHAELDGAELDPAAFSNHRFPLSLEAGEHTLTITALGRYSHTGEGLHRFVDPADDKVYCYTQFEVPDARRVFACFEQPDLKATFTWTVTAPADWTVISNANTVDPEITGEIGVWRFAETKPMSTYITAIIAGHYHVVRTAYAGQGHAIPMSLLCRQSMKEHLDADRIFATTKAGFQVFEEAFGMPYAFGSYDQAFVPEYNAGAMENAGCVTIRDEYLFRSRMPASAYEGRDNTILHELAHMWFGDLVTMRWWDDLWLNESFAEWASHFAQEEIARQTESGVNPWATFANQRKGWAYTQDQQPTTHPIAADMVDLEAVELNFDGITYAKGASALNQLVAYVGRDNFLAGVRAYFAEHAYGNTQLSDLIGKLEEASGRDLAAWVEQWLNHAGVNTLHAEFEVADGAFTTFAIRQTALEQWPTLRLHRMAVGLYNLVDGELVRTDRVELDIDGELTEVGELVGKQQPDLILLNDDDLTYAKVRLDERSLQTLVEHIDALTDGLARAVCWGAAWDMCRDAELKPSAYVDVVLRGLGSETDSTAVASCVRQALTAVTAYTRPQDRPDARNQLRAGLARLLAAAEPGSDAQLLIAKGLAQVCELGAGEELLSGWLAGEEVPEGLEIDTDLRWHLVRQLARMGAWDASDIDAELANDKTVSGAEEAAGAKAALPGAADKAAAWQLATADASVTNSVHRMVCMGFHQYGQEEVLADYAQKYLQVVEDISNASNGWADRGQQSTVYVLLDLFPAVTADEDFIAELDEWMAQRTLAEQPARILRERRQDVLRAIACRKL